MAVEKWYWIMQYISFIAPKTIHQQTIMTKLGFYVCHYTAVSYYNYIASMIIEWMNEWVWWNYNDREQLSTWIRTCLVPMCPPQIPHGLAWHRNPILTAIGSKYHLRYVMAQKLGSLLSHCPRLKIALV